MCRILTLLLALTCASNQPQSAECDQQHARRFGCGLQDGIEFEALGIECHDFPFAQVAIPERQVVDLAVEFEAGVFEPREQEVARGSYRTAESARESKLLHTVEVQIARIASS